MKTILCIDPGASGGLACLHDGQAPFCLPMPSTEGDLVDIIQAISRRSVEHHSTQIAVVEEVGGFCGVGQPGSAMFKFGRNFGFTLGVLQTTGWRVDLVKPQRWQKSLGLGTKADAGGKTAWKNKLKAMAQRLFPTLTVTLKTADALLLLHYSTTETKT